jgi:hypothetical protein
MRDTRSPGDLQWWSGVPSARVDAVDRVSDADAWRVEVVKRGRDHDQLYWLSIATVHRVLGEGATVADNIELIMRFHSAGGEDVTLISADFGGEAEALDAIARALDERRGLVLIRARYNREDGEHGVVVNLANVVSVRVSKTDTDTTGQYL